MKILVLGLKNWYRCNPISNLLQVQTLLPLRATIHVERGQWLNIKCADVQKVYGSFVN